MQDRRQMRTFTLAGKTSRALDDLLSEGAESLRIQVLLANTQQPPKPTTELDKYGLLPEDYEYLYTLLPSNKLPRSLHGDTFLMNLTACTEKLGLGGVVFNTRVIREMNARIKMRSRVPKPVVNISRVTDALIELGLSTLQERVSIREGAERSTRKNAGKSSNKLSIAQGSTSIAV